MPAAFRFRRSRPTRLARRVALFALLALELAVAFGPILEPHHEATETHIEQTGTTHHYLVHNEDTCVFCALRTMGQLPAHAQVLISAAAPMGMIRAAEFAPAATRDLVANSSRAPPVTG